MTTPWDQLNANGWDMVSDGAAIYVGPRSDYGALLVWGEGYTLQEALDQATACHAKHRWQDWTVYPRCEACLIELSVWLAENTDYFELQRAVA